MITLDLVEFIEKEQNKDVSNDVIKSRLLEAGWNSEDIEEGFTKVTPAYTLPVTPSVADIKKVEEKMNVAPQTMPDAPVVAPAVSFAAPSVQKDIPIASPVASVKPAVDPYREAPVEKAVIKDNFSTSNPSQSLPKVWSPVNAPIAVEEHEPMPTLMPKISTPEVIPVQNKTLPPLFSPERKMELAKVHATPEPTLNPISAMSPAPANNSFANKAMISSYPKDIKNNFVFEGEKKHGVPKFLVWVFVVVVLMCVAVGLSFAYTNGLINIPFLPKVNPNIVTVDITKNISNSSQDIITPADTTLISSPESTPVSTDLNNTNNILPDSTASNSTTDTTAPVQQIEIKNSLADELKNKDVVIEDYILKMELQIYKKYALNKNKYGTVSNSKGDCVAPVKNSLLYTDPEETTGMAIAQFLGPLLEIENNKGYCFSSTKSWAMSFPLATDENSYICLDSSNSKIYTKNILNGTVCK